MEVNILESSGITSLEVLPLHNSRQKGSGRAEGEWCLLDMLRSSGVAELGVGFREICKPDGIPSTKALSVLENLNKCNKTKTVSCTIYFLSQHLSRDLKMFKLFDTVISLLGT